MEEQWLVDRAQLRTLSRENPHYSHRELAVCVGRSLGWVKKWLKRFREVDPHNENVLHRRSMHRQVSPKCRTPAVIERILAIRDQPPGHLQRTPGPKTILYYLAQDEQMRGQPMPRSTRTVWQVLRQYGRIAISPNIQHQLVPRPQPMQNWQIDFKDVTSIPPSEYGKQVHIVEILNIVDVGTSCLVDSLPRADYTAETALLSIARTLLIYGLPKVITCDRDSRFVGSWSGQDFPSALIRFLLCLGIHVDICPAHRPDKNGFVERFHRTLEYECLQKHRPVDLEATHQIMQQFKDHYNYERPNQALSCGNRPPLMAFPQLPILAKPPEIIDPDAWIEKVDRVFFKRRVRSNGTVNLNRYRYYVSQKLRGRYVVLKLEVQQRQLTVLVDGISFKRIPIKGLYGQTMTFSDYLKLIVQEARSEWQIRQRTRHRRGYELQ
jgi:hypothetical protein